MSEEEMEMTVRHMEDTQVLEKFAKILTASAERQGHFCFQGERLVRMETNVETIKTQQAEIKAANIAMQIAIKADLDKYNEDLKTMLEKSIAENKKVSDELAKGVNGNSRRTDRLETIGAVAIVISGAAWAVFLWLFDKLTWK